MTISNAADNLRIFNGDDATNVFPVTFSFSSASDLAVTTRTDTSDLPQQLGVDYAIAGNSLAGQAQVTLFVTPGFGIKVIIERQTGARQPVSLTQAGAFPSEAVEASMDDIARVAGDTLATARRAVVGDVEDGAQIQLPPRIRRANRVLGFDGDGNVEFPSRDDFRGDPARIDASGPLSERALFDGEPDGFTFLATDANPAVFYIRQGSTSGSWSPGIPFGVIPGDPLRRDFANALTKVPSSLIDVSITARLILPGDIRWWPYPDLPPGTLRCDGTTVGKVGSGAAHEDDAFREAYDRIKTIPNIGNTGLEDFDAGDLVTLPQMSEIGVLGRAFAAAAVNRIQRSTTIDTVAASTSTTVGAAGGLAIGMFVFSANVPAGTTITEISGTTVTLSAAATATASGTPARFSLFSDPQALGVTGGADVVALDPEEGPPHDHDPGTLAGLGNGNTGNDTPDHVHATLATAGTSSAGGSGNPTPSAPPQGGTNTGGASTRHTHPIVDLPVAISGLTGQAGAGLAHLNLQPSMLGDWIVFMRPSPGPIPETLGIDGRFYVFDDATDKADPGDGMLRFDAAPNAATKLWIDGKDANDHDISSYIATWNFGRIEIINLTQPGGIVLMDITAAATDESGFFELGLSVVTSGGTFAKDDALAVLFVRSGQPGLSWRGAWQSGIAYRANNGVHKNGSAYIATDDHMSAAVTEPGVGLDWMTVWDILAEGTNVFPNKIDATAPPTANDDSANTSGNGVFEVGSTWVDITADEGYLCVDATATAAVWVNTTLAASELGSLALQNTVNNADWSGTALAVANGGTGSTTAPNARTALGLSIGTDVQAFDATLASLAGLGTAADRFAYTTGTDTWAEATITAAGRALIDDASAADQRVTLGVQIGVDVQAFDAQLADLAGLAPTKGNVIVGDGSNFVSVGVGSDDQVLTADALEASGVKWATPSASQDASTTQKGIVELATDAETQTGTDTARAITPANLTAKEATAAQFRDNTAERILTTNEVWDAAGLVTLTGAATIAFNMANGFNAQVTLAGNRTLGNPTNTKIGQTGVIIVRQDATGSRTLSYEANYEFAGGAAPTLTTTANAKDYLFYFVESATSIVITGTLLDVS